MFAKLTMHGTANLAGASNDKLLSDIALVIAGETDLNNLSDMCNIAESEILTDYSTSPWELWDDVAGGHKQLRCLQADSSEYKHIGLHHDSPALSSARISISCASDWDEVLHSGTDVVGPEYTYLNIFTRMDQTDAIFYIYADEFMFYIFPKQYYTTYGSVGGSISTYGGMGTFECDRRNPSLAVGDMPNWCIGTGISLLGGTTQQTFVNKFCKGRDYLGNVVSPLTTFGGISGRGSYRYNYETYTTTINGCRCPEEPNDPPQFAAEHLTLGGSGFDAPTYINNGSFMGSISARCNIWAIPAGSRSILDIMLWQDRKYIVMKAGYTSSTAGLDVGMKFIVPYG
jgi:hypothetical protein